MPLLMTTSEWYLTPWLLPCFITVHRPRGSNKGQIWHTTGTLMWRQVCHSLLDLRHPLAHEVSHLTPNLPARLSELFQRD